MEFLWFLGDLANGFSFLSDFCGGFVLISAVYKIHQNNQKHHTSTEFGYIVFNYFHWIVIADTDVELFCRVLFGF